MGIKKSFFLHKKKTTTHKNRKQFEVRLAYKLLPSSSIYITYVDGYHDCVKLGNKAGGRQLTYAYFNIVDNKNSSTIKHHIVI